VCVLTNSAQLLSQQISNKRIKQHTFGIFCEKKIITPSSTRSPAVTDKLPDACTPMLCCQELLSDEWLQLTGQIFKLSPDPLPSDGLNEGDPLELSGSSLVREN